MQESSERNQTNENCDRCAGNGAILKDELKAQLEADDRVSAVVDLSSADITYPQASFLAAQAVRDGKADRGILVCGTGIGTAIAASKVSGVRAATAHDLLTIRGSIENYDAQRVKEGKAKSICAVCPVLDTCRQFAMESGELYGVWGGLTESDRHKMAGRRRTG